MTSSTDAVTEAFAAFDFGLDGAEEERARRLHADSIVIDMLFQGPCGYRSYGEVHASEARGNLAADWVAVKEIPIRLALAGEFADFYGCWEGSGITLADFQP